MQFTICFETPFWVGLLEVERDGLFYAARYVFGSEPSNQEIYEFVQKELNVLYTRMTAGIVVEQMPAQRKNPKRMQRELRRELASAEISTKAQTAMRQQIEQNKQSRLIQSKAERELERIRHQNLKRIKAKNHHRGR